MVALTTQSFLHLWPLIKFDILVPYAHSSTSSLLLFTRVKVLRAAGSISLGSKEATTTGYQGPVVTVFLNRAFCCFLLLAQKTMVIILSMHIIIFTYIILCEHMILFKHIKLSIYIILG